MSLALSLCTPVDKNDHYHTISNAKIWNQISDWATDLNHKCIVRPRNHSYNEDDWHPFGNINAMPATSFRDPSSRLIHSTWTHSHSISRSSDYDTTSASSFPQLPQSKSKIIIRASAVSWQVAFTVFHIHHNIIILFFLVPKKNFYTSSELPVYISFARWLVQKSTSVLVTSFFSNDPFLLIIPK